ncbi:MAG: transposase [Maricaulaceae bacterium]|jgi:putative transposase
MPNYRRLYMSGGEYFFTVNLRDRRSDLLVTEIDALKAAWRDVARERPFETVAAVVLPDHLHALWRLPPDDHDFSTRWRLIKHGFTRRLPDVHKAVGRKGERGVWQPRFWEHLIRDEDDFENCLGYIHWNPVKHGHVEKMDDWPHSTWRAYKRELAGAWTPPPEALKVGEP